MNNVHDVHCYMVSSIIILLYHLLLYFFAFLCNIWYLCRQESTPEKGQMLYIAPVNKERAPGLGAEKACFGEQNFKILIKIFELIY